MLCTPWETVQANDIKRAEEIFLHEVRVDPGFALVITRDHNAEARLGAAVPDNRRYVFVQDETLETAIDPQAFLRNLLRDALGRRRLFDLRPPAAGPQFFGREKELEALERDVRTGHSIGVYGLRKVGKTSLLRRLGEKFRERATGQKRVIPVEVDLQLINFRRRNLNGVVALISRQLDDALERAQIRVPAPSADPLDRLVETVVHVERVLQGRVVLVLDEYEVLLGGKIPPRDGVDLLTWLRGLAQTHAGSFNLVLAGRNPKLLASARIEGADNPMYRFLRSVRIAGLTPEDCRTLVKKLGGRMGLRFEAAALESIVRETGGHPALVRTLGNLIDEDVPMSDRNPAVIDATAIKRVLPRFSRLADEDMRELVDASNDINPGAGDYLVHLSYGVSWIGGASEARIDDALVDYGILHPDTHEFRIGHLRTWLRDNHSCPAKVAHG